MEKLHVALLSGGISSEREVSLSGGDSVYQALDKSRYDISRYDPKTDLERLVHDAGNIDIALIILHGPFGEDGTVQGLLDLLGIPYQGSGVIGSALAMNKYASKRLYAQSGLPVPPYIRVGRRDTLEPRAWNTPPGLPLVIKPVSGGSSIGMRIVHSADDLAEAVTHALDYDDSVLIESYINGTELTVGVIGNDELDPLPVIEIIPDSDHAFFDYDAKYSGSTNEICPARIDEAVTQKAQSFALTAHRALFCRGYSRTDMIYSNDQLYVLETNTIPGMTPNSLLPLAAKTAGFTYGSFLDKIITLGIEFHSQQQRTTAHNSVTPMKRSNS